MRNLKRSDCTICYLFFSFRKMTTTKKKNVHIISHLFICLLHFSPYFCIHQLQKNDISESENKKKKPNKIRIRIRILNIPIPIKTDIYVYDILAMPKPKKKNKKKITTLPYKTNTINNNNKPYKSMYVHVYPIYHICMNCTLKPINDINRNRKRTQNIEIELNH